MAVSAWTVFFKGDVTGKFVEMFVLFVPNILGFVLTKNKRLRNNKNQSQSSVTSKVHRQQKLTKLFRHEQTL